LLGSHSLDGQLSSARHRAARRKSPFGFAERPFSGPMYQGPFSPEKNRLLLSSTCLAVERQNRSEAALPLLGPLLLRGGLLLRLALLLRLLRLLLRSHAYLLLEFRSVLLPSQSQARTHLHPTTTMRSIRGVSTVS